MKRWAILTVLLYAVLLLLLTAPFLYLTLGNWWGTSNDFDVNNAADVYAFYKSSEYWIVLAILLMSQALLLLVPVDVSQRRLTPRRKLLAPIITSAFLFANLVFGMIFSAACAIWGDKALNMLDLLGKADSRQRLTLILVIGSFWVIWGVVFYFATRASNPQDASTRLLRWLLRGSILELLVAVPSHIIVRNRDVCCATIGSFWGIATGLSVMLLCYGPGVFFLYIVRIRQRQSRPR